MTMIKENDIVLFQGDSITDCGHLFGLEYGEGYAMLIASLFSEAFPEKNVKFLNRGISGHRVKDLKARWTADCLDLKPNWVSILIGINDVWRRYDSNDPTSVEAFEADYRDILTQTKEKLGANLIIMEPFLLPHPEDRIQWREDLDPKIEVARKLAEEFDAIYIPLDEMFKEALNRQEAKFWAADGVHPTPAGHGLIAKAWLKAVGVSVEVR